MCECINLKMKNQRKSAKSVSSAFYHRENVEIQQFTKLPTQL